MRAKISRIKDCPFKNLTIYYSAARLLYNNNNARSDEFTPSRDTPCQYFIKYKLYKGSWDKSNCL
jgi:hypothetical protein